MNVFFLGAGFSQPAGLPLGDELCAEVLDAAKSRGLYEEDLKHDINEYLDYYYAKTGKRVPEDQINLEEFMSYIDINNHLVLHGGHTSPAQGILKNLIAYVLHSCEIKITDEQFLLYEHFVERLGPQDMIFTFNYDTILEKTLKRKNIPYRLYEHRYRYDEKNQDLVPDWKDEVNVFKMHGSINWFDITGYEETKKIWEELEIGIPPHLIFNSRMNNEIHRLLDDPFPPNHPFRNIYIVGNLDKFFIQSTFKSEAPVIVPPSYHKLANLNYLSDFWYRFSDGILKINKMAIIGFSLPAHDEYIRQPLYWYIRNFHEHGESLSGKKLKLKIIDYKKDKREIGEFKANYRFANKKMTDFHFNGFSEDTLDFIFSEA
jgi:hypothetical protein